MSVDLAATCLMLKKRKVALTKNNAKTVTPAKVQTELREAIHSQHFYQCNVCGGMGCFQRLSGELYSPDLCPVNLGGSEWKEVSPKNKRGFHVSTKR
jgi:hypothetical protein